MSTYQEKLKDPRWQKKRLEILNRDNWTCKCCGDQETTLHVHHRKYSDGDPWDTEDNDLFTLCELCHQAEHDKAFIELRSAVLHGIDSSFLNKDIFYIDVLIAKLLEYKKRKNMKFWEVVMYVVNNIDQIDNEKENNIG